MKKLYLAPVILSVLFSATNIFAQPASITWPLTKLKKRCNINNKLLSLLVLFLLTFMLGGTAHADFWEPAGLCGSSVFCSTTNGANWNSANSGITPAYSIVVVPCFKNRIVSGGHNA